MGRAGLGLGVFGMNCETQVGFGYVEMRDGRGQDLCAEEGGALRQL